MKNENIKNTSFLFCKTLDNRNYSSVMYSRDTINLDLHDENTKKRKKINKLE